MADSLRAGLRADQYGLGATLYYLLTGRVPFSGGSPGERALRRLTEAPVPVDDVRPGLPAGLGTVVGRLLAQRAGDRFGSMAEVAAALAPFAATAPVV